MRYLVTGGCGFIGSHLVDRLVHDGYQVTILDNLSTGKRDNANPKATLVVGDICDSIVVSSLLREMDGCFHLAAVASVQKSVEQWLHTHQVNASGTVTIFDAIAKHKSQIPVVYASSAAVYGDNHKMPLSESTPVNPLTAYGVDKYSCELSAKVAYRVHGIPTLGLRFFNVYGPRQDPHSPYSGVISIFSDKIAKDQPVTVYGDGEQVRDFIYVKDVVRALIKGMKDLHHKPDAKVMNVCTGKPTSLNKLIHTMEEITGHSAMSDHKEARSGDIRISYGDNKQLQKLLSDESSTDLKEGLSSLFQFQKGVIQS